MRYGTSANEDDGANSDMNLVIEKRAWGGGSDLKSTPFCAHTTFFRSNKLKRKVWDRSLSYWKSKGIWDLEVGERSGWFIVTSIPIVIYIGNLIVATVNSLCNLNEIWNFEFLIGSFSKLMIRNPSRFFARKDLSQISILSYLVPKKLVWAQNGAL